MSNVIPWRRRATMAEAARVVAPTDGEFQMLREMVQRLETMMQRHADSVEKRMDKQDENLDKINLDLAGMKTTFGNLRMLAMFLGVGTIGGIVQAWQWLRGSSH